MEDEASTEPPPSEAGPGLHAITEPPSSSQSMLPRPSVRVSSIQGDFKGTTAVLANYIGPRTTAKTSVPNSFAPSAAPTRSLAVTRANPLTSKPPNEKLKARMKMRENLNSTIFSYTKPRAPTISRMTRSVTQKRIRSRSASVGPTEPVRDGLCFKAVDMFSTTDMDIKVVQALPVLRTNLPQHRAQMLLFSSIGDYSRATQAARNLSCPVLLASK